MPNHFYDWQKCLPQLDHPKVRYFSPKEKRTLEISGAAIKKSKLPGPGHYKIRYKERN